MYKPFSKYLTILLTLTVLIFAGCSKDDDTTAPVITLIGNAIIVIDLQETYNEPGATATDDNDGSVAVSITGSVNNNLKGTYTITYTATDAAGNTASATRTVQVVNSADFMGGNYVNVADVCNIGGTSSFDATVTISNSINGQFTVSNFGAFGNSVVIICNYNSTTNAITATTPQSLGGGATLLQVFNSSGVTSNSPTVFKISYQWSDSVGLTDTCESTYTK